MDNRKAVKPYTVNVHTGEVYDDFDAQEGVVSNLPVKSREVDEDYRRDNLPQYNGFGNRINEGSSEKEIFDIIMDDISKVTSYDGLPTKKLGEFGGRIITIAGASFTGVDSFKPRVLNGKENTDTYVKGYDKLLLKVTHMSNTTGALKPVNDPDNNFWILETSAVQPMTVLRQAAAAGLTPGDWPEGVNFKVYVVGNVQKIAPHKVASNKE